MNWDYIAGFFDGEGNIHKVRGRQLYTIGFVQCESNKKAITAICRFLNSAGVKHYLRHTRREPPHQDVWRVVIQSADNVLAFLRPIVARLIVKRTAAKQAIAFCEGVVRRKTDKQENIKKAIQAYVTGECPSINQARRKFRVADKTLRKYLFELGHRPARGRSETQSIVMKNYLQRHPDALKRLRENGRKGASIRWR